MNGVGKDIGSFLNGYFFKECGIRITLYGYSVISIILFTVLAVYTLRNRESRDHERVKADYGIGSDIDKERFLK